MRKRLMCHFLPVIQVLFSIFMISCTDVVGSKQEGDALKMFIASVDPGGKVAKQWSSENPCSRTAAAWLGVKCTGANALNVTSLILDKMNLTGSIPEGIFSQLTELRILSLSGNGLTGQIPSDLIHCAQLKQLYLEDNALSGPIPSPLSHRLKRIDLSNNKLTGAIPSSLGDIDGLLTLFLDSNMLEGGIPSLNQQSLLHFNISNNNLSGEIPSTISSRSFSPSVFMGNALLCGSPLQSCSGRLQQQVLGSDRIGMSNSQKASAAQKKLTASTIIVIIFASIAFVLMTLCLIIYCYYKGIRCVSKGPKAKKKIVPSEREDFQSISTSASAGDHEDKPRLVFFEENNTFRLEELLRASAELLGKGSLGCAYKAVLEDGRAMCVKRLNINNNVARSEFEEQMQLVGRLRHPNVVPLWAYYYAKEEKLLVYQYQPNGNLHDLLLAGEQMQGNGGRAMTLKPLSWKARLRIAKGIAKGLAYLHSECESQNIPHGNIKASNILIDKDYEARIADFGLASPMSLNGKAPHIQVRVTQKADVYSFGVVLLELLTGRVTQDNEEEDTSSYITSGTKDHAFNLPQWVTSVVKEEWSAEVFDRSLMASISSEESLINMLQIAMACTSKSPDQRPHMAQVHKMIADIHAEELTASYSTSISMDQVHKMIADIHEEELTASYSTSISMDQVRFQFVSNDDSTMMSIQAPFYDNHEASFRF